VRRVVFEVMRDSFKRTERCRVAGDLRPFSEVPVMFATAGLRRHAG
jgi:hypothetical protein